MNAAPKGSDGGARGGPASTSGFQRRWLAEAVRHQEDRTGRARDDVGAEAKARAAGQDLEARVLARAEALPQAPAMGRAIAHHVRVGRWLIVLALVLALLAGVGSARLALGAGGSVNFVPALGALLGVQVLMLIAWLVVSVLPAAKGAAIGRALVYASAWLSRRLAGGQETGPVIAAGRSLLADIGIGRWLLGAVTHAVWLAFTLGALLACLLLLVVYQYDFHWATTILPDAAMVTLLLELGRVPASLGLSVPDAGLIAASRLGVADGAGREQWSVLLLSALVLFGLLPRALLAALCAAVARRRVRAFRLDLARPGYARLAPRLRPTASALGTLPAGGPAAEPETPFETVARGGEEIAAKGLIAMLGVELERSDDAWPPQVEGVDWVVLGRADDRSGRRDVLAALQSLPAPPACLVVVVSLLRTPDRGTGVFLRRLKEAAGAPMLLLLDEGDRLRRRGGDVDARATHWRALGARAGADAVQVQDLERREHHAALRRRLGLAA